LKQKKKGGTKRRGEKHCPLYSQCEHLRNYNAGRKIEERTIEKGDCHGRKRGKGKTVRGGGTACPGELAWGQTHNKARDSEKRKRKSWGKSGGSGKANRKL